MRIIITLALLFISSFAYADRLDDIERQRQIEIRTPQCEYNMKIVYLIVGMKQQGATQQQTLERVYENLTWDHIPFDLNNLRTAVRKLYEKDFGKMTAEEFAGKYFNECVNGRVK